MMSNNKILTVSYGTFSCTLEGFDDSFDTMKAIAEYFRDLAADDRYFGAEPPQPDAEMLARIAEREIARRVEAQLSETGVHLRAGQAALAFAPDESHPASEVGGDSAGETTGTVTDATSGDVAEDLDLAAGPIDGSNAGSSEGPSGTRIPEPSRAIGPASLSYSAFSLPGALSAGVIPPSVTAQPESAAETDSRGQSDAVAEDTADDAAASFFAQRVEEEDLIPVAEDVPASEARPSPNSIAYKLQRIRAVVSKAHEPAAAYSEDEHADAILDAQVADSGAAITDVFAPEADVSSETPAPAIDENAGIESEAEDDHVTNPGEAEPATAIKGLSGDFEFDEEDRQTAEPEPETPSHEEAEDDAPEYDFSSLFADEEQADPSPAPDTTDAEPEPETPAVRARVIKVKRAELEAALHDGMLEEAAADRDWSEAADSARAEDPAATEDRSDPAEDTDAARPEEEVAAKEEELDRLMAEADHQMDEPEGTHRRAAFEQMRGAVAATRADGKLGTEDAGDEDHYRTDLAAAVTPRRPVATGRTDRPREPRPAPLKLVAEQRIDVASAPLAPVRPRRVAATAPDRNEEADGFADYAAARGAHDLPDLLEAAAAYLSFVEGREQFSRPQVMNKVLQIDPEGFSREDGLRHFGQLLRAGKIEKIKGGRFAASEEIGFRPDGKQAAG